MRLAGSIVTLASGIIGLIMGIMAYMAVGAVLGSPEMASALSAGNDGTLTDEQLMAIAGGAAYGFIIFGMVMAAVVTLMGALMFRSRSLALGIVAIVCGVLAIFGGLWVTLIGSVIGGILFLVGRNS